MSRNALVETYSAKLVIAFAQIASAVESVRFRNSNLFVNQADKLFFILRFKLKQLYELAQGFDRAIKSVCAPRTRNYFSNFGTLRSNDPEHVGYFVRLYFP